MPTTTTSSRTPRLRFPGFSDWWKERKIQELIDEKYIIWHLDWNHWELYPRSEEFSTSWIPYISANDFIHWFVDDNNCKFLPISKAKVFKKWIAQSWDVLFAHNATVWPVAILNTNYEYVILSTTATFFRCNSNKLNNYFLKSSFLTNRFIRQYTRVMSQSTRNQVPITAQRKFKIFLPTTLPEQTKIASFLSAVDDKISRLTDLMSARAQYKSGIMSRIFSQEIRFLDDHWQSFPEWEEKKLGEVFHSYKWQWLSKDDINKNWSNKCILYGELYTTYQEVVKEVKSKTDISEWTISKKWDLLIPCSTTTSWIDLANVTELQEDWVFLWGDITILRFKDKGNSTFFAYYLTHYKKHDIARYAQWSTIVHLYYSHFKNINISLPSLPEQIKIANFLSQIDHKISDLETQIETAKQRKKGLLQGLFI